MSTTLAILEGEVEYEYTSLTAPAELHATAFYGGAHRGKCLQLTIAAPQGARYVILTKAKAAELRDVLNQFLAE